MTTHFDRRSEDIALTEHRVKEELRLLEIENNLKHLEVKIDNLSNEVSELVSAWKAASLLVSTVKWVGSIAAAITAILILMKVK